MENVFEVEGSGNTRNPLRNLVAQSNRLSVKASIRWKSFSSVAGSTWTKDVVGVQRSAIDSFRTTKRNCLCHQLYLLKRQDSLLQLYSDCLNSQAFGPSHEQLCPGQFLMQNRNRWYHSANTNRRMILGDWFPSVKMIGADNPVKSDASFAAGGTDGHLRINARYREGRSTTCCVSKGINVVLRADRRRHPSPTQRTYLPPSLPPWQPEAGRISFDGGVWARVNGFGLDVTLVEYLMLYGWIWTYVLRLKVQGRPWNFPCSDTKWRKCA